MRYLTIEHLSLTQVQVCKGLAILFIVVHNFLSKLKAAPHHNEFVFKSERFWQAISIIENQWLEFIRVFMTFFGHYGVQIFLFLSAYGLMRSINTQPNAWPSFVLKRVQKLLLPMILVMSFYLLLDYLFNGIFSARMGGHDFGDVILRLLFISNFMTQQAFLVIGPWWFLSVIVQFYCLFLLLHALQLRFGNISLLFLLLLSIMLMMMTYPWLMQHQFNLKYSVLGHLPDLILGMYVGSLSKIKMPIWLIVLAGIGLILGNTLHFFWYFASLCAIVVIMVLYVYLLKYLSTQGLIFRTLEYMGILSMYMFLLNGVIREPFIPWAKAANDPLISLGYTAIITLLTIITAQLFFWFERYLKNKFLEKKPRKMRGFSS